jgi:mono/diheme cytochrome c family protein
LTGWTATRSTRKIGWWFPLNGKEGRMRVWVKRIGYTAAGLAGVAVIAAGAAYAASESRFRRSYAVAPEELTLVADSVSLARGEHLASTIGCAECHGEGLRGAPVIDAPPMGRVVALNLTRGDGGVGAQLTPALVERAVRHGVGHDGHALRIMPSDDYQNLSDDDMRAIASYVAHATPVNNVLAPSHIMLLPRVLMVAGVLPMLPAEKLGAATAHSVSTPAEGTTEYGLYLANLAGCRNCHGPGLSGGKMAAGDPSWGPAANITTAGGLGKWSEAQFREVLRTGRRPDGSELKVPMPWKTIGHMTDDELHAIWLYLHSVPPRAFGNR